MKRQSVIRCGKRRRGSALILAVILLLILSILSIAVLKGAEGAHMQAVRQKRQTAAVAAADAAYERAIFAMSQQADLLSTLAKGSLEETVSFLDSQGSYSVSLASFLQAKPVFKITAVGQSGLYEKTIHTYVVQAVNGWAMGKCKIPTGRASFDNVVFSTGEVLDIPIEINKENDSPDVRDIKIDGSPVFLRSVHMGESRYTSGGTDKYAGVMGCFKNGIYFDQPMIRITDSGAVETKIQRFRDTTAARFCFTPVGAAPLSTPQPAVQLEFFTENGVGKVRITNNCTVRGFRQSRDDRTFDFRIKAGSGGQEFERYPIYGYHVCRSNADSNGDRFVVDLTQTYVTQDFGGVSSEPAGQIFVDGNVIVGGDRSIGQQPNTVQGQITIAATGNIWIADSITVSDRDNSGGSYTRQANGMPNMENPNVLGLFAQGVIKVVDPGMSQYSYVDGTPKQPTGYTYVPIGLPDKPAKPNEPARHLPDPIVVEASVTVGGGGWGAENVKRSSYGGRKETSGSTDDLILRGSITEAVRGVVGVVGQDGYTKKYYWDERLLTGILPGNIWLKGKYVPLPGAWTETVTELKE